MRNTRHGADEGFTLVELLIVVVILGILAGVVVFAVGNTTGNATTQACRAEGNQFVHAYAAYQVNHGGTPPAGATTADMAATLAADNALSSATLSYLSPAQGGTVATLTTPRWTWDAANHVVDDSVC